METKEIVVIGGGIIGCTTSYYLSKSNTEACPIKITLMEASSSGPAQGASGKAGGLVARWAYPKEIVNLSFNEHVKLAEEHGGAERWGWRYVACGSWEGRGENNIDNAIGKGKSLEKTMGLPGGQKPITGTKKRNTGLPQDLDWVVETLTDSYTSMAQNGDTAQVHPYLFTTSMFELAQERGVEYIHGRATAISTQNGRVSGVQYVDGKTGEKSEIPATHVVLTAGAWSSKIIDSLPISATRAHSITIRPPPDVSISPYVLFTEIYGNAGHSSPEIYARPGNEVYACGPGDDEPLPPSVDDVVVDQEACESIHAQVSSISHQLRSGTVEKRQACYLPSVASGGGPIIGEASSIAKGLYIGTGHTCWGISNAPGTARALTELITQGKITSANLKKLDPKSIL